MFRHQELDKDVTVSKSDVEALEKEIAIDIQELRRDIRKYHKELLNRTDNEAKVKLRHGSLEDRVIHYNDHKRRSTALGRHFDPEAPLFSDINELKDKLYGDDKLSRHFSYNGRPSERPKVEKMGRKTSAVATYRNDETKNLARIAEAAKESQENSVVDEVPFSLSRTLSSPDGSTPENALGHMAKSVGLIGVATSTFRERSKTNDV